MKSENVVRYQPKAEALQKALAALTEPQIQALLPTKDILDRTSNFNYLLPIQVLYYFLLITDNLPRAVENNNQVLSADSVALLPQRFEEKYELIEDELSSCFDALVFLAQTPEVVAQIKQAMLLLLSNSEAFTKRAREKIAVAENHTIFTPTKEDETGRIIFDRWNMTVPRGWIGSNLLEKFPHANGNLLRMTTEFFQFGGKLFSAIRVEGAEILFEYDFSVDPAKAETKWEVARKQVNAELSSAPHKTALVFEIMADNSEQVTE